MIYPINQQIEELLNSFIDEETGELTCTEEEMQAKIETLQMEFNEKIVQLRNKYINCQSEAEALKKEKMKLAARQTAAEKEAERAKRFIAWLLKGEKFQDGAVKISYRKSEEVVADDGFIEWASVNAPGLLNFKAPEPRKADIKAALKAGHFIEHVSLVEKQNVQVK